MSIFDYFYKSFKKIREEYIFAFSSMVVSYLAIHMFMITNKLFNNDDALVSDGGAGITSGRWLKGVACSFSSQWAMPWVTGILCALYLGFAVVCIVSAFEIRNKVTIVLLVCAMSSFPVIACTMAYMITVDGYMMSIFFTCLGVWGIVKLKRFEWVWGSCCVACSLAIYQAYLGWMCSLIIIYLILLALNGERQKIIIRKIIVSIVSVFLGLIFYKIILDALLRINGGQLTAYMGINGMWDISISKMFHRLLSGVNFIIDFYTRYAVKFNSLWIWGGLVLLTYGIIIVQAVRKKLSNFHRITICMLLIAFSISLIIINLMSDVVHVLMIYGYTSPVILAIMVVDRCKLDETNRNKWKIIPLAITVALCVLIIGLNIIITNKVYFKIQNEYEKTYAFVARLAGAIESTDGYYRHVPIYFCGNVKEEINPYFPNEFNDFWYVRNEDLCLRDKKIREFSENYIGTIMDAPDENKVNELIELYEDEIEEMECYPSSKSIINRNGVIIVKFSD